MLGLLAFKRACAAWSESDGDDTLANHALPAPEELRAVIVANW